MKRRLNLGVTGGFGALAIASALGCEAQVDEDYTGEPLLSLQGNVVVAGGQADNHLVPRIAFPDTWDEGDNSVVLIDGEVTGDFPAKFRFDVTQPPPDSVLGDPVPELGFDSKHAFGLLVLRPTDSSERITAYLDQESSEECNSDGSECTRFERDCDGDRCRERVFECTQRPCELIEQFGDPEVGQEALANSSERCDAESCYTFETRCDTDDRCRSAAYRCDFAQYGEWDTASDGTMTTCRLESESGDTSLVELDDLQEIAINYAVVYVTEDNPDTLYGPLERGYNLLALPPPEKDTWLAEKKCEMATFEAAVVEYNQEHGTDYGPQSYDFALVELRIAAIKACHHVAVVEQPLGEVLTIEMGSIEPTF